MVEHKIIERTPKDIAYFFETTEDLSKQKIGEYLGDMYVQERRERGAKEGNGREEQRGEERREMERGENLTLFL